MKIHYKTLMAAFMLSGNLAFGQEEGKKTEDMYELSLEELMNVPIKSASKKEETVFDAPLSSYTITRAEIDKAGSTSIMEALRLAPGVIVREQANGVYDIHIRGMENLTRTSGEYFKSDAYTLVMIDNRPVFNHGLGGTFWESLPVDLNDVDRIEIVRGPSSPLFGPNAVTGVINIITKRMGDSKTYVNANVQGGTTGTSIGNMSLGKTIGKFSALVTANGQDRQRFQNDYFNEQTGAYVPLDQLNTDPAIRAVRYPHPSRSLNRWGANANLGYQFSSKVNLDVTLSSQQATSQRLFVSNPLEYTHTYNRAANVAFSAYGFKLRSSYLHGYNSDERLGTVVPNTVYLNGSYNFDIAEGSAEYDFKITDKYTITPGVSYQSVKFDDDKYSDPQTGQFGYFNAKHEITTQAAYLRSDLNFTKKFRVIAAGRVDKFSTPDKAYLAYELAGTYKLNDKNLVRLAFTKSNSGSFMGYNFVNVAGGRIGDQNLKLFTLKMIEAGYRVQLMKHLQVDADVFYQEGNNLTAIITKINTTTGQGYQQFSNVPTSAHQYGATVSVNYVASDKLQFKPFVTFQKTETKDLPSVYDDATVAALKGETLTYSSSTHKYTPGLYGGFTFNYHPISKLNINLSSYFYGKQQQYDASWNASNTSTAQYWNGQINQKFMLNAKVSYEVVKGLNVFLNARNAFGTQHREFYASDKTGGLYLAGASFTLNK